MMPDRPQFPSRLRVARVRVRADCGGLGLSHPGQLCAGAPGRDACQGDSGGPLVVQETVRAGAWTVVGLVSAGRACAHPEFPGLYTRLAHYTGPAGWLTAVLAGATTCPSDGISNTTTTTTSTTSTISTTSTSSTVENKTLKEEDIGFAQVVDPRIK